MNAVGSPVQAGYSTDQSQSDNTAGQTTHWTKSRTVRAVAGLAVIALGALAGWATSFFASVFLASIAAAAVTVVAAVVVVGYCYSHNSHTSTNTIINTSTPALPAAAGSTLPTSPSTPAVYDPAITAREAQWARIAEANLKQEEYVKCLLANYGYHFYKSSRDGNCFYDSIVHQCPELGINATELRCRVADYARYWQECFPFANEHFSPLESRAHARLLNDVGHEMPGRLMVSGLEEIGTVGRFADQIDAFFAAQVLRRPIVVIDTRVGVSLAVDGNGDNLNIGEELNPHQLPLNTILLVHDGGHFMGKACRQRTAGR